MLYVILAVPCRILRMYSIIRSSFGKRKSIFRRILDVTVNREFRHKCVLVRWTMIYTTSFLFTQINTIRYTEHDRLVYRANKLYV